MFAELAFLEQADSEDAGREADERRLAEELLAAQRAQERAQRALASARRTGRRDLLRTEQEERARTAKEARARKLRCEAQQRRRARQRAAAPAASKAKPTKAKVREYICTGMTCHGVSFLRQSLAKRGHFETMAAPSLLNPLQAFSSSASERSKSGKSDRLSMRLRKL